MRRSLTLMFRRLHSMVEAKWVGRSVAWWATMAALSAFFVAATWLDWDLRVAERFYDGAAEDPWPVGAWKVCQLVDRYGAWLAPALALGFAAWAWTRRRTDDIRNRRASLWLVMVLVVGPGLAAHGTKAWWGRSRPRDVYHWKRPEPYRAWWAPAGAGEGASFPSGHAASAAALVLVVATAMRRRTVLRTCAVAGAGSVAIVVSACRVVDGAHFVTDVTAGALVTGLTAGVLASSRPDPLREP